MWIRSILSRVSLVLALGLVRRCCYLHSVETKVLLAGYIFAAQWDWWCLQRLLLVLVRYRIPKLPTHTPPKYCTAKQFLTTGTSTVSFYLAPAIPAIFRSNSSKAAQTPVCATKVIINIFPHTVSYGSDHVPKTKELGYFCTVFTPFMPQCVIRLHDNSGSYETTSCTSREKTSSTAHVKRAITTKKRNIITITTTAGTVHSGTGRFEILLYNVSVTPSALIVVVWRSVALLVPL